MKKIALGLFMLFVLTTSFGQSKEETMLWLKNYGLPMLYFSDEKYFGLEVYQIAHINDDYSIEIKLDRKYNDGTGEELVQTSTVNTDCLSKMYLLHDDAIKKKIKDTGQLITFSGKCISEKQTGRYNQIVGDNSIYFFFNKSTSNEQKIQFYKALMHLAKLHGVKPKPEIKKDMFK